jgi:hypothetical protein
MRRRTRRRMPTTTHRCALQSTHRSMETALAIVGSRRHPPAAHTCARSVHDDRATASRQRGRDARAWLRGPAESLYRPPTRSARGPFAGNRFLTLGRKQRVRETTPSPRSVEGRFAFARIGGRLSPRSAPVPPTPYRTPRHRPLPSRSGLPRSRAPVALEYSPRASVPERGESRYKRLPSARACAVVSTVGPAPYYSYSISRTS